MSERVGQTSRLAPLLVAALRLAAERANEAAELRDALHAAVDVIRERGVELDRMRGRYHQLLRERRAAHDAAGHRARL